jgi:hypothetical protein
VPLPRSVITDKDRWPAGQMLPDLGQVQDSRGLSGAPDSSSFMMTIKAFKAVPIPICSEQKFSLIVYTHFLF